MSQPRGSDGHLTTQGDAWLVLAPIDRDPVAVLASALALAGQASSVELRVLDLGRRPEVVDRMADLLRTRGIRASVDHLTPAALDGPDLELQLHRLCAPGSSPESKHHFALDVSAASGELALRAHVAAQTATGAPLEILSFRPESGVLSLSGRDHFQGGAAARAPFDFGAGPTLVSALEFLQLYGFRRVRQDPYTALCHSPKSDALLTDAALAILQVFKSDPSEHGTGARFRQMLQFELKAQAHAGHRITVDLLEFPRLLAAARLLEPTGLVRIEGGKVQLSQQPDQGACFFFSGGWLEIAAVDALRRALPDRPVELNLSVDWGDEGSEAENDVVFVAHNRLYIVSCKNEWVEDRIWTHLDRLRALVAEFGEAWVRPALFSTRRLSQRALERAKDYEVAVLSGQDLLSALAKPKAGCRNQLLNRLIADRSRRSPEAGRGLA